MDRVEETIEDEDEVSFAPTPSPEEARARLAALRGRPLDAPSKLVSETPPLAPAPHEAGFTAATGISTADLVAAIQKLLGEERPIEALKADIQKVASKVKIAGQPMFKPVKVRITTRVDADVLEAFKALGPGWQTRMNDVLRENMPTLP